MQVQGKASNQGAQIFIGDLHPSVSESDLFQTTSKYGQVVYIRVLRHIDTRISLGFAFVSFTDPIQANTARVELNGLDIKGKHIRVMKYCKERDPEANLFINNLPEGVTSKELDNLFSPYGSILSTKLVYDSNERPRGYGFVQFEKQESAKLALESAKNLELNGSRLIVEKFVPMKERNDLSNNRNLYVRGFDSSLTDEDLHKRFSTFGEITSHVIMKNEFQGQPRYFGFVCFDTAENARKAASDMNGRAEGNFTWFVVPHMKKALRLAINKANYQKKIEEWKRRNLYIRGIPTSIDEEKLKKICETYGQVESVLIPKTENVKFEDGRQIKEMTPRGIAYVCYVKAESANKALAVLRDTSLEGNKLFVAHWKPREEVAKLVGMMKMRKIQSQMWEYGMMGNMMGRGRGMRVPGFAAARPKAEAPSQMLITQPFVHYPPPAQPQPVPQPQLPFNISDFNAASADIKKRMIGEAVYPQVLKNSSQQIAGKITGMLLEMDNAELLGLLQNPPLLLIKVQEAIEVLRKAWSTNPDLLKLLDAK
ncbi:unnamed protein product [Blepharisma stoltei]|uniref:Polyadenylate-binding protein n=1 Tax=Blepharisma stoltei TaxID=1481888 RepID=A0AAU9K5K2_9CILI|nr:unnamed protein product [Blepharisma stoltei]